MEYRVTWTIDLDAGSPEDAAREALSIQRDPGAIATHFTVTAEGGRSTEVDLGCNARANAVGSVYVVVPMEEGIVRGVGAFSSKEEALHAEEAWLKEHGLTDEESRYRASDFGTGIAIWECNVAK